MHRSVVLAVVLASLAIAGCHDPTADARGIEVRNDLDHPITLRLCDSLGCDHLNDHLAPGQRTAENVNIDDDLYTFQVVDTSGTTVGCLNVRTHPLPSADVLVSEFTPCK